MSDNPTVQRAADVISWSRHESVTDFRSPSARVPASAIAIAEALAAAGFLADPSTPTLTPEQADVIEWAQALGLKRLGLLSIKFAQTAVEPFIAAVDRLAAATDRDEPR